MFRLMIRVIMRIVTAAVPSTESVAAIKTVPVLVVAAIKTVPVLVVAAIKTVVVKTATAAATMTTNKTFNDKVAKVLENT